MTTLLLIRHGETSWNANGRWQGHTDIPLNDRGREQARLLAEGAQAHDLAIDAIYSSDLLRAWETATILGEALGISVAALPSLRELDIGSWSGKTSAEIMQEDAELFQRMKAGEDVPRGGAETLADLTARVADSAERLVQEHPNKTLAVVAHGGTIRALLHYIATHTQEPWEARFIDNTSITTVRHSGRWQIVHVNDTAHLNAERTQAPTHRPDDATRV